MRASSACCLGKARHVAALSASLAAWKAVRISSFHSSTVFGRGLPFSASVSGLWVLAAAGTNLR